MLTFDFFRKYLFSSRAGSLVRTISWICILGIGVGVLALIVVISVMNGFNDSMKTRLLNIEPHLTVHFEPRQDAAFRSRLFEELKSRPDVQVSSFDASDAIVRTVDGYVGGAVIRGLDPQALDQLAQAIAVREKTKPRTYTLQRGEVLMGVDLAVSLGVFEDGEIVVIAPEALLLPKGEIPTFERLRVKAILTTGVQEIDSKLIFYGRGQTLARFQSSASHQSGLEVRFAHLDQAEVLQAELKKRGLDAQTWSERNSALFYALKLEKLSIGLFLSLSALIASFSIVAVLMLLMTQKRKDLGLLMALGLSQRRTRRIFTNVGLLLSFAGIGGGLVLGAGISLFLQRYPLQVLPAIYQDRSLPASVNFSFIAVVVCVASLIALFSSWIPAWRNTRMTPSEALRGFSED